MDLVRAGDCVHEGSISYSPVISLANRISSYSMPGPFNPSSVDEMPFEREHNNFELRKVKMSRLWSNKRFWWGDEFG